MAWTEAVVVSVLRWVAWSGVAATVGLLEGETGPETGPVLQWQLYKDFGEEIVFEFFD